MTEWKLIVFHEDDEKDPEIFIFDDFNKLCNFLKKVPKYFPDATEIRIHETVESMLKRNGKEGE